MSGKQTTAIKSANVTLTDDLLELENALTQEIIDYSGYALENSKFFGQLALGDISLDGLKYIFSQYRHWRDQFHTWFGLCILKSGSCAEPNVTEEVKELAEHILVEMKENHAGMYIEFLKRLGVTENDLSYWGKGDATRHYEQSFVNVFGTGTANFSDSVLALSARELFASIRNAFVARGLKQSYGIAQSPWWELHETLEVEHFRGAIRPIMQGLGDESSKDRVLGVMKEEINRHVDYWDALLKEAATVQPMKEKLSA